VPKSKNVKLFFSIFLLRSKGASLYSMEKRADLMTTKHFGIFRYSLQCRGILGGRNLVRVCNIVVATIFDFMTVEDWGE